MEREQAAAATKARRRRLQLGLGVVLAAAAVVVVVILIAGGGGGNGGGGGGGSSKSPAESGTQAGVQTGKAPWAPEYPFLAQRLEALNFPPQSDAGYHVHDKLYVYV